MGGVEPPGHGRGLVTLHRCPAGPAGAGGIHPGRPAACCRLEAKYRAARRLCLPSRAGGKCRPIFPRTPQGSLPSPPRGGAPPPGEESRHVFPTSFIVRRGTPEWPSGVPQAWGTFGAGWQCGMLDMECHGMDSGANITVTRTARCDANVCPRLTNYSCCNVGSSVYLCHHPSHMVAELWCSHSPCDRTPVPSPLHQPWLRRRASTRGAMAQVRELERIAMRG